MQQTQDSKVPINIFYSYAHEDKRYQQRIKQQLGLLRNQGLITQFSDQDILPGQEWKNEINRKLETADIILLLVSPAFLDSEMKRALERHQAGTVRVIPVILRRTFWQDAPFRSLQILPTDAKPVTQWSDRDEAFWDITVGIHKAILDLRLLLKTKQEWINEGSALYDLKRYEEALAAYEQAIRLDPNVAVAYNNKGNILYDLKRYKEALAAYEQAIRLDPNYAYAYHGKGLALDKLRRSKEAQQCYEKARQLGYNG